MDAVALRKSGLTSFTFNCALSKRTMSFWSNCLPDR
jgi:hypothetical protein